MGHSLRYYEGAIHEDYNGVIWVSAGYVRYHASSELALRILHGDTFAREHYDSKLNKYQFAVCLYLLALSLRLTLISAIDAENLATVEDTYTLQFHHHSSTFHHTIQA